MWGRCAREFEGSFWSVFMTGVGAVVALFVWNAVMRRRVA